MSSHSGRPLAEELVDSRYDEKNHQKKKKEENISYANDDCRHSIRCLESIEMKATGFSNFFL